MQEAFNCPTLLMMTWPHWNDRAEALLIGGMREPCDPPSSNPVRGSRSSLASAFPSSCSTLGHIMSTMSAFSPLPSSEWRTVPHRQACQTVTHQFSCCSSTGAVPLQHLSSSLPAVCTL